MAEGEEEIVSSRIVSKSKEAAVEEGEAIETILNNSKTIVLAIGNKWPRPSRKFLMVRERSCMEMG